MSSENTLTGRLGKFVVDSQLVARCTQWDVNPTLDTSSEWGDSDCNGYTAVAPGRRGASFNAEGKFDQNTEVYDIFQPEDIVVVTLFLNNAAPLLYWDFPRAMCNDFNLTVNIDSEEVIGWTSAWKADGVFHYPGHPDAAARTIP